jgi:hypothetical protein
MNPTRALSYLETGEIPARNFLCLHYGLCLETAIDHAWPSFTCASCCDYERPDWNPELWEEDARRATALIAVTEKPSIYKRIARQ